MYVNLKDGSCKISIKYHYDTKEGNHFPYATSIYMTLPNGEELEGYSAVHPNDQFCRSLGRKYALMSAFRKDNTKAIEKNAVEPKNARVLTKDDRETLFRRVCPELFGLNRRRPKTEPTVDDYFSAAFGNCVEDKQTYGLVAKLLRKFGFK